MTSRRKNIVTGVFVVILFAAFFVFYAFHKRETRLRIADFFDKTYRIVLETETIFGADKDDLVYMNDRIIGYVSDIVYDHKTSAVHIHAAIDEKIRIPRQSSAFYLVSCFENNRVVVIRPSESEEYVPEKGFIKMTASDVLLSREKEIIGHIKAAAEKYLGKGQDRGSGEVR